MDRYLEFAANHTLLVVALSVSFFVLVFSELRRKASGLINIEPTEAVTLMNNDAMVIDLRTVPSLFQAATLLTQRTFHLMSLVTQIEKVAKFKDKPIVAVCDVGRVLEQGRGLSAQNRLRKRLRLERRNDSVDAGRASGRHRQENQEQGQEIAVGRLSSLRAAHNDILFNSGQRHDRRTKGSR